LTALDGRIYTLDDTMCVIADDHGRNRLPASWAGGDRLFGATTDVLIESALWEPLNIAQTGRKLGIIQMPAIALSEVSIRPSRCRASTSRPA